MRSRLATQVAATLLLTGAALWTAIPASGADGQARFSPDLGGKTTRSLEGLKAFTFPAGNLHKENQRAFFFGNRLFNTNWVTAPASLKSFDGLGPLFNRTSCSGCHTQDGRGRPPLDTETVMDSMLLRLSIPDPAKPGGAMPHPAYGDQLSDRAIGEVPPEGRAVVHRQSIAGTYADGMPYELEKLAYSIAEPAYGPLGDALMISPRVAPQVIGLGLLEAVPEAQIIARADPEDKDGDGISGRPNHVTDPVTGKLALGRFGWKANQASLMSQNAGAAFGDIGLTNPLADTENCTPAQTACRAAKTGTERDLAPDFLEKLTTYTRLLAVPAQRNAADPEVIAGAELFFGFGCANCHAGEMQAGADAALPELAGQVFHPFTDLLLHDMGDGLADGRPDGLASGSEWRTPPLWGIGHFMETNKHDRMLHDGRARGPAEAILWHGGEAGNARNAFVNASAEERAALVAFLNSL